MKRLLIVGFDGLDSLLLKRFIDDLPTFKKFFDDGAISHIQAVHPALTPVCWTSLYTGSTPARHGITGWHFGRVAKDAMFTLDDSKVSTIWDIMTKAGLSVGAVHMPMTYPATAVKGYMVSGVPTPWTNPKGTRITPKKAYYTKNAQRIYHRMVYPQGIRDMATEYPVDLSDLLIESADYEKNEPERILETIISRRLDLVESLERDIQTDVLAVGFMMIDRLYHFVLQPAPPKKETEAVLHRWYVRADQMLATLMERYPAENTVIMSDHGGGWKRKKNGKPAVWHTKHATFGGIGKDFAGGWQHRKRWLMCVAPTILKVLGVDCELWKRMSGKVATEMLRKG